MGVCFQIMSDIAKGQYQLLMKFYLILLVCTTNINYNGNDGVICTRHTCTQKLQKRGGSNLALPPLLCCRKNVPQ